MASPVKSEQEIVKLLISYLDQKIKYCDSALLSAQSYVPSTSDVSKVTLAAFLRPAGKLRPIFSSFSRKDLPPFLDLALCVLIKSPVSKKFEW